MPTMYDLNQMRSLPLDVKIDMTRDRIRKFYTYFDGEVYLSFSGGKDSTVLKHIIDGMYDDVPSVFCDTGLEFPEIREFVKLQKNVVIVKPKKTIKQVIEDYGYPIISKEQASYIDEVRNTKSEKLREKRLHGGRIKKCYKISEKYKFLIDAPFKISDKCCDVMKKNPLDMFAKQTHRMPIIATMTGESRLRMNSWIKTGCNIFDGKRPQSKPMSFWTEQDVLRYILDNNLQIASVYGEIEDDNGKLKLSKCQRTGCMLCGFGVHLENNPNRFQMLAKTHPAMYKFAIDKLKYGEIFDYLNTNGIKIDYKLIN